jgi:DNA mismatch repair protein MutL
MPALPSAHPNGTRIDVRDLFFSTPARLKFLKSDRAEYLAVRDVLYRLALARPDVGFKLTHDGRTSLNVERNQGLATRIHDILGNDFLQACIDIDAKRESVQLKGLVGLPTFHRANALDQYVFVNGRPVRDKILSSAVRGAYADVMPSGRHPAVVLFLNVPPEDVDVNVHPAKSEVRFKDAALIRGLIVGSIRHAVAQQMRTHVAVGPSIVNHASVDVSAARTIGFSDSAAQETFVSGFQNAFQPQARVSQPDYAHPQSQIQEFPLGAALAQIHGTYVLSQTMNGMVITDQHAAHERLVYERLKGQMSQGGVIRQGLLVPVIVDVRPDEAEVLLSFSSEVLGCGLEIEPFGKDALCVQSVPALLGSAADVAKLVKELAQIACESLHDSGHPADVLQEEIFKVLSRAACYGSVRAGRILNISEMNALLREMEQTPNSAQCNHGRPTHISLDLKQIERLFARR